MCVCQWTGKFVPNTNKMIAKHQAFIKCLFYRKYTVMFEFIYKQE